MQIVANDLSKSYGQGDALTHVLKDVSFEIPTGQFVAIMGTSGSGKTTLLNIMGGLDTNFKGSITLDTKHKLESMSERELARQRNENFGFIFQQFHLLDHLSALENITLPDFFQRGDKHKQRSPDDARKRALSLLDQVGLLHKQNARPTELSGGQKQRVAIARALYNEPHVLFCDEPTGSLDRETGEQIMDLFKNLNAERELTLIVVTHEEHIARMAERILRLEDGVLISDEITQEAQAEGKP